MDHWAAFAVASLVLAVTPGPGVLYIVTRSVAQGRRAGFASALGIAGGNFCNALLAGLGLAAVLAASPMAFQVVKYAGAAYLIYLGVQTFRAGGTRAPDVPAEPAALSRVARDGFLIGLLHPKTALFFAAFLPQFMDPERAAFAQGVMLASLFVAIAVTTDSIYAYAAGSVRDRLRGRSGFATGSRRVAASMYCALGLATALSGRQ